jgi:hypothetical protein
MERPGWLRRFPFRNSTQPSKLTIRVGEKQSRDPRARCTAHAPARCLRASSASLESRSSTRGPQATSPWSATRCFDFTKNTRSGYCRAPTDGDLAEPAPKSRATNRTRSPMPMRRRPSDHEAYVTARFTWVWLRAKHTEPCAAGKTNDIDVTECVDSGRTSSPTSSSVYARPIAAPSRRSRTKTAIERSWPYRASRVSKTVSKGGHPARSANGRPEKTRRFQRASQWSVPGSNR